MVLKIFSFFWYAHKSYLERQTMLIKISGCTGVGKTDIALKLAEKFNIKLISCDSVQLYKELNIATNKPDDLTSHLMLNLESVLNPYDVIKYTDYVQKCIEECRNDGKIPLIVGGTGFYMEKIVCESQCFHFFLTCDRSKLYKKTDDRCEQMILNGLLKEVFFLKRKGLDISSIPGRAIGYRDAFIFLDSLKEDNSENIKNFYVFVRNFQRRTRNYIRKQEVWARTKENVWIDIDKFDAFNVIKNVLDGSISTDQPEIRNMDLISRQTSQNYEKKLKRYQSKEISIEENEIIEIIEELKILIKEQIY